MAAIAIEDAAGILDAEPNYRFQHQGIAKVGNAAKPTPTPLPITANDTYFGFQWHLTQANVPQAWSVTQGSANTIVAVIDTGIKASHPDFAAGRFVAGFDMISDPTTAADGDGRDANPDDPGDGSALQPSSYHGTHVAGTIGANTNNSLGVAGIDWNCKLMIVRVLGRGGGSLDDIANGILFAARLTNASGTLPAQRADIVNMSLGGPGASTVLTNACNAANTAGCLLVAAAGNDNTNTPFSPAATPSVLSVGAVDLARQRAPYSNFNSTIDLWAPGGDMSADLNGDQRPDGVLSNSANDQGQFFFEFENGTSMASPHVAGVAALIKSANPALTNSQIRALLLANTQAGVSLPNQGRLLDALAAVQAAAGSTPSNPILVASATSIDFGSAATTQTIDFSNRGSGTLVFQTNSVSPAAPWLQIAQANPPVNGTGITGSQFVLTINRSLLATGTNQTQATFQYLQQGTANAFPITVPVVAQGSAPPQSQDTVFVIAVDPNTFETLGQAQTDATSQFAWTMTSVPPGTYLIAAGTDRNNDNFINDAGELFGMWPLLDTPLELTVGPSTVTGLDIVLQAVTPPPPLLQASSNHKPMPRLRRLTAAPQEVQR
jgi:serine protease